MVEGEARFVPEDVIIDALEWGRNEIQPLLDAQEQLRESCGKPKMVFEEPKANPALLARVERTCPGCRACGSHARVPEKLARKDARKAVKTKVMEALFRGSGLGG